MTFQGKDPIRWDDWKETNEYQFEHCYEIFLCETYVRIPELGIDGKMSWYGSCEGFSLSLHRKGGQTVFVNIQGKDGSSVTHPVDKTIKFEEVGYELELYEQIAGEEVQFTLLDEFKRDFSKNPIYNEEINISADGLVQILQTDLVNLLSNPNHADITFQCKDGGSLMAHRIILASRCAFFKNMFDHNTVESTGSIVQCGFKTGVMKAVLEYIYSGKMHEEMTFDLYEASDYYDIHGLKMMCLKLLFERMTSSNVIAMLKFAESLNATELRNRALTWITWKATLIKETEEYTDLVKSASNCESGKLLKLVDKALEEPLEVFDEATNETD